MTHDPWQLYLDNEAGDSEAARIALETAWSYAKEMATPQDACRHMERVMRLFADRGAMDSEGYQELDRRMRSIWPNWT